MNDTYVKFHIVGHVLRHGCHGCNLLCCLITCLLLSRLSVKSACSLVRSSSDPFPPTMLRVSRNGERPIHWGFAKDSTLLSRKHHEPAVALPLV